jgi:hypothetical protein
MVAITAKKKYEDIVASLKEKEKVALFSCNTCTRMYDTGGVEIMNKFSEQLEKDLFLVTDKIVLTAACFEDYLKAFTISDDFTTAIVLACDSGYGIVKRNFPHKNVICGLKTLGIQQGRNPKPVVLLEV